MRKLLNFVPFILIALIFTACGGGTSRTPEERKALLMQEKVEQYAEVSLEADLSHLSDNDLKMLSILIDIADIMDELFWLDAIGDKEEFMAQINDEATKQYAEINYGPWDRLDGNSSFVDVYGEKPAGANYYPADITEEEFQAWEHKDKTDWYSLVRRDDDGNLIAIKYHEAYAEKVEKAASLLEEAAEYSDDPDFKLYLLLRAKALRTDDYLQSDLAWMDMKENPIDFVVGPIESYEDAFKGFRAAHSGQILVKDVEWSKQIELLTHYCQNFKQDCQYQTSISKKNPPMVAI